MTGIQAVFHKRCKTSTKGGENMTIQVADKTRSFSDTERMAISISQSRRSGTPLTNEQNNFLKRQKMLMTIRHSIQRGLATR